MSAQRLPVALLSESALRQRRDELSEARRRITVELRRIERRLTGGAAPRRSDETAHGTMQGYKAHREIWHTPACAECRAWHAWYRRQLRARRRVEQQPNPEENTVENNAPAPLERITQPKTDLTHGPGDLWYSKCRHCEWTYGPSVKSYVQEREIAHRRAHRAAPKNGENR